MKGLFDRVQEMHRNMDENNKALVEIKTFNHDIIQEMKIVKAKYDDDEHK